MLYCVIIVCITVLLDPYGCKMQLNKIYSYKKKKKKKKAKYIYLGVMTLYIKINKHIKIYTVIIVFRVRNNRFQGYSKEKIYLFPLTFLKTNWVGKQANFFSLNFYLDCTVQESNLNRACTKIAIKL